MSHSFIRTTHASLITLPSSSSYPTNLSTSSSTPYSYTSYTQQHFRLSFFITEMAGCAIASILIEIFYDPKFLNSLIQFLFYSCCHLVFKFLLYDKNNWGKLIKSILAETQSFFIFELKFGQKWSMRKWLEIEIEVFMETVWLSSCLLACSFLIPGWIQINLLSDFLKLFWGNR